MQYESKLTRYNRGLRSVVWWEAPMYVLASYDLIIMIIIMIISITSLDSCIIISHTHTHTSLHTSSYVFGEVGIILLRVVFQ